MVMSDGSSDSTLMIAKKKGAIVLENKSQKRLAFSFRKLVERALEEGADIAVNIDADLQFRPEEIPEMIKPILEGKSDFVAADRFTDKETGKVRKPKNMAMGKYISNRLGSWIVSKLTGYRFPDVTCGFRAYNREALLRLNLNSQYTYTQESFQVLALAKLDISSIPVSIKYYPGRKSRVVTSFLKFLFSSAINIVRAFRDFAPLQFFGLLGGILFFIGLILDLAVFFHYFNTGSFTPFISVILIGVYLITLGIIAWIIGLVADMLDRIRNNQDKILYEIKSIKYKN
ncbi:MAG: glycosyltransferase family 2 protein, partial [Ignavibacteriae bacterium]|nr:glycosyltransferase family 2 protein [Ignavibacteriota bacterium]